MKSFSITDFHIGDYVRIAKETWRPMSDSERKLLGKVLRVECLDTYGEYPVGAGETWFELDEIDELMSGDEIRTMHFNCGTVVITENDAGIPYVINCEYFYDLYKDWYGDCNLCPANDAPVYFAMYNSEPVNPYKYKDFESFMKYMIERTGLDR